MMQYVDILFVGDIVGRPGRQTLARYLEEIKNGTIKYGNNSEFIKSGGEPDFIIANVENASHGFGLTERNHGELSELGVHAFTSGNHIWDKKDIFKYIETSDRLIRPLNYPEGVPGVGYRIFETNGIKICVINLLGRVFMTPVDNPWTLLEKEIEHIKSLCDIVIVDFHAEATAEKISFGHFANSLGISAVIGTHTHVQTADEKILNNGTAYITDVGFCGASNGVIGMDVESSLKRLKTNLPERFDVAPMDGAELNGVRIIAEAQSGKAKSIERICFRTELNEVNK